MPKPKIYYDIRDKPISQLTTAELAMLTETERRWISHAPETYWTALAQRERENAKDNLF